MAKNASQAYKKVKNLSGTQVRRCMRRHMYIPQSCKYSLHFAPQIAFASSVAHAQEGAKTVRIRASKMGENLRFLSTFRRGFRFRKIGVEAHPRSRVGEQCVGEIGSRFG